MLSTLLFAGAFADSAEQILQDLLPIVQRMEASPEFQTPSLGRPFGTCPGNRAFNNIHTMAQMTVTFESSCDEVREEIKARVNGENGWQDPHNKGTYRLESDRNNVVVTARRTGDNKFTDKQSFALQAQGNGCRVNACSESQGTSAADGGTNMCDMWNLFCNGGETNQNNGLNCKPVKNDLIYNINNMECANMFFQVYTTHQCQNTQQTCLAVPTAEVEFTGQLQAHPKLTKYSTCPGSGGFVHAASQMKVTFDQDCDTVTKEIVARANGANGWTDPHNHGTYTLLRSGGNVITTKRLTGDKKFTDAQSFALSSNGGGCVVNACSESQGLSAADGGTNMCDMFALFCNSNEVGSNGVACRNAAGSDLTYQITNEQCTVEQPFGSIPHKCQARNPTCVTVNMLEAPQLEIRYIQ